MKTIARFFTAMMIASLFVGQVYAQTTAATDSKESQKATTTTVTAGKFIDKNSNGICDNHEARVKEGKCNNKNASCCGQGQKNCCDKGQGNCQGSGKENCKGQGSGQGNCKGQGSGKGNCTGNGQGNGNGCQHRHGCEKQSTEPKK